MKKIKIVNNFTKLSQEEFISFSKRMIRNHYKEFYGACPVIIDDIFVVWYCKTLQNHKALLGITGQYGEYFEATYDGDNNKVYLDVYKKDKNIICEPIRIE